MSASDPALPGHASAPKRHWRQVIIALVSLPIAAVIWSFALPRIFTPTLDEFRSTTHVAPRAHELARRQLALWNDPAQLDASLAEMRISNAEWDFMGRTFLTLALCNMALHEPERRDEYLTIVDLIIDQTITIERELGQYHYLMPYAHWGDFRNPYGRSLFVDGEIALMLAARQAVESMPKYTDELARRVDKLAAQLDAGPVVSSESYPDECWMFCNAAAIAAIAISDQIDGRDHSGLIGRWLTTIHGALIDDQTGLLVSSFTYDGRPLDGPEGTSIFFVAHMLELIDPAFAADQYARARHELRETALGFGYAREWPASWVGMTDIDSGPIVPGLNLSAGASGMAIIGASAFDDDAYLRELLGTLEFAAFPIDEGGGRRYAASNQVGDAVLLYALVQGPLWDRIKERDITPQGSPR